MDDCQFPLPGVEPAEDGEGDMVSSLADEGVELDGPAGLSRTVIEALEPRCTLGSGVKSAGLVVDSRLAMVMGRKRSRVRSKISEPMAPMAPEYRSLRILDSLTKNSAKSRTRSASSAALASLSAKALNLSIVARENWSTVWPTTICRFSGLTGDLGPGVMLSLSWNGPLDEDRLCGGGVGRAFGAMEWCGSGVARGRWG